MRRTLTAASLVLAAGLWFLYDTTLGLRALTQETARRVAIRDQPRSLPALTLQLQDGSRARIADLRGRVVVATFMYTSCQSVCPLVGAYMGEIHLDTELNAAVDAGQLHFLSLSFDPDTDTPSNLAAFADRFDAAIDNWWVARPRDPLEPILRFFGVTVIPAGPDLYVHNAAYYLIDRQSRLIDILDYEDPQALRAALRDML